MKTLLKELIDALEEQSLYSDSAEIAPEVLKNFFSLTSSRKAKASSYIEQLDRGDFAKFAEKNKQNNKENMHSTESQPDFFPTQKELTDWESSSSLEELNEKICNCHKCRLAVGRTNFVFGEGNPNAELMFIGEGPGRDEDLQGRPFVGKAGQLLTKMIIAMGYERAEVYIANVVKCRPPENRVPERDEAETCLPYLMKQISLIKPKAIILLGATPARYILRVNGINEARGKWFYTSGIMTMPTYHPAFLLRNPSAKAVVWEDLKLVMKFLGKKIPK